MSNSHSTRRWLATAYGNLDKLGATPAVESWSAQPLGGLAKSQLAQLSFERAKPRLPRIQNLTRSAPYP
jgi:hypothetical protein